MVTIWAWPSPQSSLDWLKWGRLRSQGSPSCGSRPPHPRKSFTSSTVTSPVMSSVVSALVAESMDSGERVASGSSRVSAGRK